MNTRHFAPQRILPTPALRHCFAPLAMLGAVLGLLTSLLGTASGHSPTSPGALTQGTQEADDSRRCIIVEVFVNQNRELDQQLENNVKQFAREREGMLLGIRKLQDGEKGAQRLAEIAAHFKIEPGDRPLIYCMNRVIYDKASVDEYQQAFKEALQLEVFVRDGCSRCTIVKRFLPNYAANYPAIQVLYRDIGRDRAALQKLDQLVAKHQRAAASVPVIHVCDQLLIGLSSEQSSSNQLDGVLQRWTKACPKPAPKQNSGQTGGQESEQSKSDSDLTQRPSTSNQRSSTNQAVYRFVAVSGVTAPLPFSCPSLQ